jgi:hypothetical protein
VDGGATRGEDGGPAKFDKQSEARRVTLLEDLYLDFRIPAIRVSEPLRERNTKNRRKEEDWKGRKKKKRKKRRMYLVRWNARRNALD